MSTQGSPACMAWCRLVVKLSFSMSPSWSREALPPSGTWFSLLLKLRLHGRMTVGITSTLLVTSPSILICSGYLLFMNMNQSLNWHHPKSWMRQLANALGKGMNLTIVSLGMSKYQGRLGSFTFIWQLVWEKENWIQNC